MHKLLVVEEIDHMYLTIVASDCNHIDNRALLDTRNSFLLKFREIKYFLSTHDVPKLQA